MGETSEMVQNTGTNVSFMPSECRGRLGDRRGDMVEGGYCKAQLVILKAKGSQ